MQIREEGETLVLRTSSNWMQAERETKWLNDSAYIDFCISGIYTKQL